MIHVNSSFLKDVSVSSFGKLIGAVLKFALRILVLRLLTKEDFGVISTLSAFVVYFDLLADFSSHPIVNREMVKNPSNRSHLFISYYLSKLLLGISSAILFIIASMAMGYFEHQLAVIFISLNIIANSLANTPDIIWQTSGQFKKMAIYHVISIFGGTVASALIIYTYQSYNAYFIAVIIASFIALLLKHYGILKEVSWPSISFKTLWKDSFNVLRESFPLLIGSLFYLLCYRIDVILLEKLGTLQQVADYNAAFTVLDQFIDVLWAQFLVVLYPKLVQMHADNPQNMLSKVRSITTMIIPLFFILTLLSYFLSPTLFALIFGEKYYSSGIIVTLLLPAQLFFVLFSLYYRVAIIYKKTSYFPAICAVGALVSFVTNFSLVPLLGVLGTTLATTATAITIFVLMFLFIYKGRKNDQIPR